MTEFPEYMGLDYSQLIERVDRIVNAEAWGPLGVRRINKERSKEIDERLGFLYKQIAIARMRLGLVEDELLSKMGV